MAIEVVANEACGDDKVIVDKSAGQVHAFHTGDSWTRKVERHWRAQGNGSYPTGWRYGLPGFMGLMKVIRRSPEL